MVIGVSSIDFLGLNISQGRYSLQPNIASQLENFPNTNLFVKQLQEFHGIVNYMPDFIPHFAKHRQILSSQLRRNAPAWSHACTSVVQALK